MKSLLVALVLVVGVIFMLAPRVPQPETLMAKCKDGTVSYSKKRSGTCSHHGGVVEWIKK